MSIESEKKRLNDFLVEQTAVHQESKRRAREHAANVIAEADALADFAIKTLKDHVGKQIALMEAADAHA
jgi:hypothetical protein